MITFFVVFLFVLGVIGYIPVVFIIGFKIQDWCFRTGRRGDILWPWIWTMVALFAFPIALIMAIVNP